MKKKCSVCKDSLLISKFGKNKTKKDGLQTHCMECGKKRNKEWYEKNRSAKIAKNGLQRKKRVTAQREVIWSKAEEIGCHFCKEKDRIVLDFHHLHGKEFCVGESIGNVSWQRIKDELKKCVVLCSNCHRRVHGGQKEIKNPTCVLLK